MTLDHHRGGTDPGIAAPTSSTPSVGKNPLVDSNTPSQAATAAPSPSQIAQTILANAGAVPRALQVRTAVAQWNSRAKPTHDTMATLKLMMVCKALSLDAHVAQLLATDEAAVKQVVASLASQLGRQIIQAWNAPAQDIAERGEAWDIFLDGYDALSGTQTKLDQYFENCLGHDKGYGQTHESTQGYVFLMTDDAQPAGPVQTFNQVLALALGESVNSNVWIGGQANSGKIRDQLARGVNQDKLATIPANKQEEQMWSAVTTAIFNAHSPGQKDWSYAQVIRDHDDELFATVGAIVGQTLARANLEEVLELLGV